MADSNPLQELISHINTAVENRYSDTQYTDSYVGFIDILGMKNLINQGYGKIRSIFNAAIASRELYGRINVAGSGPFIGPANLRMSIMSDAVVLSIDANSDYSFSKIAGFTSYLLQQLLEVLPQPVFLRGGITRGEIYQDEITVFGPGLVDSYLLENDVAKVMRCVVSPSLENDPGFIEYISGDKHALEQDPEDNLYFIKFARKENLDLLEKAARYALNSDIDDSIKSKYQWLLDYVLRERGT